ncbi:putative toxin-antitoxin system toxin component, PIN family [Exilibacterium tricleocarpae]|uniref:Putative toxin-antitoxin system toxin component, PIN family n=1 Tax=Exilibacterium tricleocarpae TaxID=2591008 RepID=A0A545TUZ2_9GAMM|nr:putative toxin-antitoxin system toxin component, PIN family [Exilibacterium tricleocarpae]TQV81032.1 putative toxin-antitoxin system toxin component, PIN family [Exilibacterium tricleocarpae]
MLKLVLDTDVIVAAMRSPKGASAALLDAALNQDLIMLASVPLFVEYDAKCTDPRHWTEAELTGEQAHSFVNGIATMIKPVKTHFLWRPVLRDPNDEMVLEVAMNGQADAIVTFNHRDFGGVSERFNVDILLPSEAIRRVRNG